MTSLANIWLLIAVAILKKKKKKKEKNVGIVVLEATDIQWLFHSCKRIVDRRPLVFLLTLAPSFSFLLNYIMKTRLFKYNENFTTKK